MERKVLNIFWKTYSENLLSEKSLTILVFLQLGFPLLQSVRVRNLDG